MKIHDVDDLNICCACCIIYISCKGTFVFNDDNTMTRLANLCALCNNATSFDQSQSQNIRRNGTVQCSYPSKFIFPCYVDFSMLKTKNDIFRPPRNRDCHASSACNVTTMKNLQLMVVKIAGETPNNRVF